MSTNRDPAQELADSVAGEIVRAIDNTRYDSCRPRLWADTASEMRLRLAREWLPRFRAFLAEREAEWRKEGPERERILSMSLSAQMKETERLQGVEEQQEGQVARLRAALEATRGEISEMGARADRPNPFSCSVMDQIDAALATDAGTDEGRSKVIEGLDAQIDVFRAQRDEALGQVAVLRAALESTEHADDCPEVDFDAEPDTCTCHRAALATKEGARS